MRRWGPQQSFSSSSSSFFLTRTLFASAGESVGEARGCGEGGLPGCCRGGHVCWGARSAAALLSACGHCGRSRLQVAAAVQQQLMHKRDWRTPFGEYGTAWLRSALKHTACIAISAAMADVPGTAEKSPPSELWQMQVGSKFGVHRGRSDLPPRSPGSGKLQRPNCKPPRRSPRAAYEFVAFPFSVADLPHTDPSAFSGETKVASPKIGNPPKRGRPLATRLMRRPSELGTPRPQSRRN